LIEFNEQSGVVGHRFQIRQFDLIHSRQDRFAPPRFRVKDVNLTLVFLGDTKPALAFQIARKRYQFRRGGKSDFVNPAILWKTQWAKYLAGFGVIDAVRVGQRGDSLPIRGETQHIRRTSSFGLIAETAEPSFGTRWERPIDRQVQLNEFDHKQDQHDSCGRHGLTLADG
jgi:hypothetical protein